MSREHRGTEAGKALLARNFTNPEDLLAYLQEMKAEEDRIKETQKRRPLREGDQFFRMSAVIDGMTFWSSVVFRTDGSVEFWMRRYREEDTDEEVCDTTHRLFTLVQHLCPKQEPLAPEVGGAVLVNDPCGSRVVWVD